MINRIEFLDLYFSISLYTVTAEKKQRILSDILAIKVDSKSF